MDEKCMIKGVVLGEGMPVICVPVIETTEEAILTEIEMLVAKKAEMIEWRVDYFEGIKDKKRVNTLLKKIRPLVEHTIFLFTFRSKKQGGELQLEENELDELILDAAHSRCVDMVDLEFFETKQPEYKIKMLQELGVKVITSHHDFHETPPRAVMEMLLEKMRVGGADIVKLAVMPQSKSDVLTLLELTDAFKEKHPDRPIVTMSMGEDGMISRVCGETFGSCMTFGSHEKPSAPGQLQMDDLKDILVKLHDSRQ